MLPNVIATTHPPSYDRPRQPDFSGSDIHVWLSEIIPLELMVKPMSAGELAKLLFVPVDDVELSLICLRAKGRCDWLLDRRDQAVMHRGKPVWMSL